jgi:anti-sigma regulatory factor (Ser/Thr protein kinase)
LTDRAIPLALIASELITNAAKYAYAGQGAGTVRVVVSRQSDRHIAMRVSNDGVGLPLDFNPEQSKGFRHAHSAGVCGSARRNSASSRAIEVRSPCLAVPLDSSN